MTDIEPNGAEPDPSRSSRSSEQRYSFASFGDEAVLLDLQTGGYFMLNRTAERICRILFEGGTREVTERRVSAELRISGSDAHAAVEDVTRQLSVEPPRISFPGPFTYFPAAGGYHLCFDGAPVLEVRADGRSVRRLPFDTKRVTLAHVLRVAAPKLLSLRGLTVLHASACEIGTTLTAFCGLSGAGKTTTARAFAAAGMPLFCEDLIVLAPDLGGIIRALRDAEVAVHEWARTEGQRSSQRSDMEIDCIDLPRTVLQGRAALSLARIVFIDASRRRGNRIVLNALTPAQALIHVMTSNFLGSDDVNSWTTCFQASSAVARDVRAYAAIMPDGTEALTSEVRRYSASSTS